MIEVKRLSVIIILLGFALLQIKINTVVQVLNRYDKNDKVQPTPDTKSTSLIDHFVLVSRNETQRQLPGNKVFMSGPWVPTNVIESSAVQNPNLEFHVFNDSTMAWSAKFIDKELREKAGLDGAWDAWRSLRPWAFKVDLWRLMILWSEGGIYMDSKVRLTTPAELWASLSDSEQLSVCRDHDLIFKSSKFPDDGPVLALWNGFMSARKGSLVLLDAIRLIIDNVSNENYVLPYFNRYDLGGHEDLSISGTILLGYAARDYITNSSARVPCGVRDHQYAYLDQNDIKVFQMDLTEHSSVRSHGGSYGDLYNKGLVYCNKEVPSFPDTPCDANALLNATRIQGIP